MYKSKSIAVVVPCFNEETQISMVIETIPKYVDRIVIIDDFSDDNTVQIIESNIKDNNRVILLKHDINKGVGGSIETGYIWARDNDMDVAVVMAGDGQMDPDDLPKLLDVIVDKKVDYVKGNRLFTGEAYKKIPKIRYFGNSVLSLLTKIASGYWHIADSQCGYTAINRNALEIIDWSRMYKRYGQPNQLLVMLNVLNFRVRDVPVRPIYGVGEESGIKLRKIIFTMPYLLLKYFLWRMKEKYIIRDFHPLIFFYFIGFIFFVLFLILFFDMSIGWIQIGHVPPISALGMMFCFMSSSLFTLFAMWFDMEANKDLK